MEFYKFEMKDIDNNIVSFSKYIGKTILIVNVASKCGFTKQYRELEELYRKYKDQGLCIIGFPCRQFGLEEFKDTKEIKNFCSLKYDLTFELFSLIKVKGIKINPLYKWLKESTNNKNVKWNFEKFLINRYGQVIERFSSPTTAKEMEPSIVESLKKINLLRK